MAPAEATVATERTPGNREATNACVDVNCERLMHRHVSAYPDTYAVVFVYKYIYMYIYIRIYVCMYLYS